MSPAVAKGIDERPWLGAAVVLAALVVLLSIAVFGGADSAASEQGSERAEVPAPVPSTPGSDATPAPRETVASQPSQAAAQAARGPAPRHETLVLYGSITDPHGAAPRGNYMTVTVYVGDATKHHASCQLGRGHGDYAFPGLRQGPHRILVRAEGYREIDRTIDVPVDRDRLRLDLTLEPTWRLKVLLVTPEGAPLTEALAAIGKGSPGPRGSPTMAIATIDPPPSPLPLTDLRESSIGVGTWTGNNDAFRRGQVSLPKRYAGVLDLPEDRPYHISAVLRCAVLATERVEPGQEEVRVVVSTATVAASFATLRLRVVDPDGAPIAGARIAISDAQSSNQGSPTDADGRVEFRDLPPGLLNLDTGWGAGGSWAIPPWNIVADPGAAIDLGDVTAHKRVDCRVRFAGRPADAEVRVSLECVDPSPHALLRARDQNFGSRKEDDMPLSLAPGRYRLTAKCQTLLGQAMLDTASTSTEPIVVSLQAACTLRIQPPAQRRVELEIVDSAGMRQSRRWITWSMPYDMPLLPGDYVAIIREVDGSSREQRLSLGAAGAQLDLR